MSTKTRSLSKQGRPLQFLPTDISHLLPVSNNSALSNSPPQTANRSGLQTPFLDNPRAAFDNSTRLFLEENFESILETLQTQSFQVSFEPRLQEVFNADRVVAWMVQKNFQYYSPTLNFYLRGDDSIIAATARAQTPIICTDMGDSLPLPATDHENHLLFPLTLVSGNVLAVILVSRSTGFSDFDVHIAKFYMDKIRIYGSALFNPSEVISHAAELSFYAAPQDMIVQLTQFLLRAFHAKVVDFWCYHAMLQAYYKFDTADFTQVHKSNVGLVNAAIKSHSVVNVALPRYHSNFSMTADILPDDPTMCAASEYNSCLFAVAIRGRTIQSQFSINEERLLDLVTPFIARSLAYCTRIDEANGTIQSKRDPMEIEFGQLLDDSALFLGSTNLSDLLKQIEASGKSRIHADSSHVYVTTGASVLYLNKQEDRKETAQIRGFASAVFSGEVLQLNNPQADSRYRAQTDGKPNSLLAMPIYSSEKKVIAAWICGNRERQFTEHDMTVMHLLLHFASSSLENVLRVEQANGITSKLSRITFQSPKLDDVLEEIRKVIEAERISLFVVGQSESEILPYTTAGGVSQGIRAASECVSAKQIITIDNSVCVPLTHNDKIAGVLEFVLKKGFQDLKEKLCGMISEVFSQKFYDFVTHIRDQRIAVTDIMDMKEMETAGVPKNLLFTDTLLASAELDIWKMSETDHFALIFTVFDRYDLLKEFNIVACRLYLFLKQAKLKYNDGLHDWYHAVSVLQYLVFILENTGYAKSITKMNLLATFIAAICHDMDWSYSHNPISEILYTKVPSLEFNSIEKTLEILSDPESNIFGAIPSPTVIGLNALISRLILQTDMRIHFEQVKTASQVFDHLMLDDQEHQLVLIGILLKISDLNGFLRPFIVKPEVQVGILDEFMKVGDLQRLSEVTFTDVNQDRNYIEMKTSLPPILRKGIGLVFTNSAKLGSFFEKIELKFQKNVEKFIESEPDLSLILSQ